MRGNASSCAAGENVIDVIKVRGEFGALGHPGDPAAARAAAIVGDELGWSEDRRRQEIADLSAFYRVV